MTDTWREPSTKAFSCNINPSDYSCDNGVLFSAEAYALGLITMSALEGIAAQYEKEPGLLLRHPSVEDYMSWDDHVGLAAVSPFFAARILAYGEKTDWDFKGQPLWRFPIFIPTVRAGAGLPLNLFHQIAAASCYLWDCFLPRGETSGRIILWLASKVLSKYPAARIAILIWQWVCMKKYPGGLHELFSIYFPPKYGTEHPFVVSAK